MLPFTTEDFLTVFQRYNQSVWPAQLFLLAGACVAIALAIWHCRLSDLLIGLIVSGLWLWMGIAYHLLHFTAINPAAHLFGIGMVLQGLLFLLTGPVRSRLSFRAEHNVYGYAGAALLAYAILAYPATGLLLGHIYPRSPTFGVPCPTTIFTFAMLLWTDRHVPKHLLVVPVLWALIGSSAAWLLGVWEDLGLLAAGIIGTGGVVLKDRNRR